MKVEEQEERIKEQISRLISKRFFWGFIKVIKIMK